MPDSFAWNATIPATHPTAFSMAATNEARHALQLAHAALNQAFEHIYGREGWSSAARNACNARDEAQKAIKHHPAASPAMSQATPAPVYALPTIHINGTGARSLADEYRAFWQALDKAAEALQSATCNARDFYPQGPGAYERARMQREVAFSKLTELQRYAQAWVEQASEHVYLTP